MHRSAADVSHRALCAVLLLICLSPAHKAEFTFSNIEGKLRKAFVPCGFYGRSDFADHDSLNWI